MTSHRIPPFRLHVLLAKSGHNTVADIRRVGHEVDLGAGRLSVDQTDLGNCRGKLKIRLKQTSQSLAKLRFLLFYEMSRRCRTIKQATNDLPHLILIRCCCLQTRGECRQATSGNQNSTAANKLLQFAKRLERDPFHARQNDHPVSICSQHESVFLDATYFPERGVIEEIKSVTRLQNPRD